MTIGTSVPPVFVLVFELRLRISKAEKQAAQDSKERRVLRRQIPKDALNHLDESFLLYGSGINDSV